MRPSRVVLCCCALVLTQAASAQEPPYGAVVVDDQVVARSGPGRQYYPTGKLPRGTKLRVLRHDYGGWYAVSPPAGSFSWVDSRHVEDQGGGVGVVKGDNVIVRIGSSDVSRSDMLAGVQLSSNQKVRILGSAVLDDKSGSRYFKIEPVRGEERWIAGRSVSPVDAAPVAGPSLAQPDHPEAGEWQSNASGRSEESTRKTEPQPRASQTARHKPLQNAGTDHEDADEDDFAHDEDADHGPVLHSPAHHGPSEARRPAAPRATREPDPAGAVLQDAHRRLAQIVAGNIATWDLEPAAELYHRALLQTRSPHIRFAARQGLDRVDRYAALKENYDGFQQAKARAQGHSPVPEAGGPRLIASGDPVDPAGPRQTQRGLARNQAPYTANAQADRRAAFATTRRAAPARGPQRSPSDRRGQVEPSGERLASLAPVNLTPRASENAAPPAEDQASEPDLLPARPRRDVPRAVPQSRRPVSLVSRLEELPPRARLQQPAAATTAQTRPSTAAPPARVAPAAATGADDPPMPTASDRPDRDSQRGYPGEPEGRYDGAGTLERTAMQGLQAPEYKLVDSNGRVRYYISPALGTDLRAYLRQSVAVVGQVQYRADLRAQHITVRQVIPLTAANEGQQAAIPISINTTMRRYY